MSCLPVDLPGHEVCFCLIKGSAVCLGLSWLFYQSIIPGCVILPFFLRYYLKRSRALFAEENKRRFRSDFKDLAQMLSSFLLAGYSVENAMKKAYDQLIKTGKGKCELAAMLREIGMGQNTEQIWLSFCEAIPIEEIRDFGQIFSLSKRSGASLPEVLKRIVKQLDLKIQTEEQIETLIAGKKMEQKIMNLMPAAILVYICITSAEMMRVMYTTLIGRIVMSGCLAVYIGAFLLAERIISAL